MSDTEYKMWDRYVACHPQGNAYQQSFWARAIKQSYGHRVYYLVATQTDADGSDGSGMRSIVGILPLVHIKHFLFGNHLFSMPYADLGGALADNAFVGQDLLNEALKIAQQEDIPTIELRQAGPVCSAFSLDYSGFSCLIEPQHRVRMLLALPENAEQLLLSFKSKLRSQIHRPLKEGLEVVSGGHELMNDFYSVFAENMRDLGSPVHSKAFIAAVMNFAGEKARIFIVYRNQHALACSMILACGETLVNPWASSLRRFSSASPNMLLYWAMLKYGCDNGFKYFDFGRSTQGEGTYKFKKQWGALEKPLYWTTFSTLDRKLIASAVDQKSRFDTAMLLWKKVPVSVTKLIGPILRKSIGL
jgi:serine/alanine adding enzyme